MLRIYDYIITSYSLGFENILKVLKFRILKKLGIFKLFQKIKNCPNINIDTNNLKTLHLNSQNYNKFSVDTLISDCENLIKGNLIIYGNQLINVGSPPDWHKDPLSIYRVKAYKKHWSSFSDYEKIDIKNIWELSRFNWINTFSRGWIWTKDKRYVDCLNLWIKNWCVENPVNSGQNWMCGQEVSIRLINIMLGWYVIEGNNLLKNFSQNRIDFVIAHLERISSTRFYAEAQNNNHSISESAALYIGGKWLSKSSIKKARIGHYFSKIGKRGLEKNICKLVMEDGSFSQNSLNYHRFLLDTLCQVEIWRRFYNDKLFSDKYINCCNLAVEWLEVFVDSKTGRAPNLGANDGTFCYQLHSLPYDNFKPTLQLSYFLFKNKLLYSAGPWDETLFILRFKYKYLNLKKKISFANDINCKKKEQIFYFSQGGYVVIKLNENSWSLLRLPRYKFRPSQCDPLHFDLWNNGENILRDGGSFSYNTSKELMDYFSGIRSHNTVQFDEFNPMSRISRFLWGNWLQTEEEPIFISNDGLKKISASYRCKFGRHKRTISAFDSGLKWVITDEISGPFKKATLRWRLFKKNWKINGNSLITEGIRIKINSDIELRSLRLKDGLESNHYQSKNKLQVLEIVFSTSPIEVKTIIEFPKN